MIARDYAAERYNRRTRAMEKQADAMTRIAAALEVQALAAAASTRAPNVSHGDRVWTVDKAKELMNMLGAAARRLS